jgi:membrane-associated phospholipid phosphatase
MAPSSHTASSYAFFVIGAAWLRKHNALIMGE